MKYPGSLRVATLRIGIALLSLPSAAFWHFAAWRSALQTQLENERAGNDRK